MNTEQINRLFEIAKQSRLIARCIAAAAASPEGRSTDFGVSLHSTVTARWATTAELTANKLKTAGTAEIRHFLRSVNNPNSCRLIEEKVVDEYGVPEAPRVPSIPPAPAPAMPDLSKGLGEDAPAPTKPDFSDLDPISAAIAATLYGKLGTGITTDDFDRILKESAALKAELQSLRDAIEAGERGVKQIVIKTDFEKLDIKAGKQHRMFPDLMRYLAQKDNVWLTGPAGSFKTSAARAAARAIRCTNFAVGKPCQWQANGQWQDVVITARHHWSIAGDDLVTIASYNLGKSEIEAVADVATVPVSELFLAFFCASMSSQASRAELTGYRSPLDGCYYTTVLRIAMEHGALYCLDEIDGTNPNILVGLNELLNVKAGEAVGFPDGMVMRDEDFVACATANTIGAGQSAAYAGTLIQNGAAKDRFVYLDWRYDEELEGDIVKQWGDVGTDWFDNTIKPLRKAIRATGDAAICSPRMTFMGANHLANCPADEQDKLKARLVYDMFCMKIGKNSYTKLCADAGVKWNDGWTD